MPPVIEGTNTSSISSLGRSARRYCVAEYDAAVDAKAVGEVTLRGDQLPSGAVITDTLIHVKTAPTGAGATIALSAQSEGDLQAAKGVAEAPWSTASPKRGAITATSTPVVTTAAKSIVAKIATAALTAGKFVVIVEYQVIG